MTRQTIQVAFKREEDLVRAAGIANQEGWRIMDIYSPYPLHATAQLLGLKRSRLPRAAFVFGVLGIALALWFQFWVSAIDWPLNVGGRPWNSLPAFVPVTFEVMVLFAGLSVVFAWLVACRMYPGKKPGLFAGNVTDDSFVLEVQGSADPAIVLRLFQECGASGSIKTEHS